MNIALAVKAFRQNATDHPMTLSHLQKEIRMRLFYHQEAVRHWYFYTYIYIYCINYMQNKPQEYPIIGQLYQELALIQIC